jgi:biogenesis of lysosome-related organelles complex 1 subunit 1
MFGEITEEYAQRRGELKVRIAESKKKLAESTAALHGNISQSLNSQVDEIHENQKKIELQCRTLRSESEKLVTQSQNWVKLYASLNNSFKQIGDVTNWASVMAAEMSEVSNAITKIVSK